MRRISSWNAAKIKDNKGTSTNNLPQDSGESTSANPITSYIRRYYNKPLTTETYTWCEKYAFENLNQRFISVSMKKWNKVMHRFSTIYLVMENERKGL